MIRFPIANPSIHRYVKTATTTKTRSQNYEMELKQRIGETWIQENTKISTMGLLENQLEKTVVDTERCFYKPQCTHECKESEVESPAAESDLP